MGSAVHSVPWCGPLRCGLRRRGCAGADHSGPDAPPPPAPEPEPPAPEKPATPTGFQVASKTSNSITWTWNAVEGAHGYVVQTSADEAFDETDALNLTIQPSFTATGLAAETSVYARVAAGVLASAEPSTDPKDYLLSDWTTHVTGTTDAVAPDLPPAPANVEVKSRGSDYIEWTWDAVAGAAGYSAEFSLSADFLDSREFPTLQKTSLKISNLDAETAGYLRVRSYTGSGTGEDTVFSEWSATSTASTDEPPPSRNRSPRPTNFRQHRATTEGLHHASPGMRWTDAESYEVQQRVVGRRLVRRHLRPEAATKWAPTNECVATGSVLAARSTTFRVRAVPASSRHRRSSRAAGAGPPR